MNYTDLNVWKKSVSLVTEIYAITKIFPKDERFSLVDQMRRSAISIPSNIAEGHARKSKSDFAKFLRISLGSTVELETQVLISRNLGYITDDQHNVVKKETLDIKKMLHGLIKNLLQS